MEEAETMTAPREETPRTRTRPLRLASVGAVALAALALAACGSSSSKAATTNKPATTKAASATSSAAQLKLATADVAGLGTILVNDKGMTLYILEDTAGKPVACTDASGCTKVWPDVSLPKGTTAVVAGTGVDAALLGTTGDAGDLYATYGGFPVYTFAHDTTAGQANGQGLQSFGGTWHVLDVHGMPVTKAASATSATTAPTATTTTKAKGKGGYGY
jgi:predicted lipoprotein with Yx(FWY)xxD motif